VFCDISLTDDYFKVLV